MNIRLTKQFIARLAAWPGHVDDRMLRRRREYDAVRATGNGPQLGKLILLRTTNKAHELSVISPPQGVSN